MVFTNGFSRCARRVRQCHGLRCLAICFAFFVGIIMLSSASAFAQGISTTMSGNSGNANTIGDVVSNVLGHTKAFEILILGVCCLLGAWLVGTGLFAAVSNRGGGDRGKAFQDAGLRIGLGAVTFALPSALGIGLETLWARSSLAFLNAGAPGVGVPQNCIMGGGLGCVANNIAVNVAPIATFVAVILAFLAGLAFIGKALYDMSLRYADGPSSRVSGVTTRILIGLLLVNVPMFAGSLMATLGAPMFFGLAQTGHIVTSQLTYVPDASGPMVENFNSLMRSLFIILVMFGTLALIRGLIIIKQVADGRNHNGRTMGSGVTHLIAGVMMMNMNWTVCIVTRTFLGNVLPFCS